MIDEVMASSGGLSRQIRVESAGCVRNEGWVVFKVPYLHQAKTPGSRPVMQSRVRCARVFTGMQVVLRCQLLVGHQGRHIAVSSTVNNARVLWRWRNNRDVLCNPYQRELAAAQPWAAGMPTPEDKSI